MTHPIWQLEVFDNGAALILTPCPGTKGVELATSLRELKEQGAVAVITALETEEMDSAGVSALPEMAKQSGLEWYHLPIEDDHAPDANFETKRLAISPRIHQILADGGKVVLHCMGGSGRTGLLAAHILLELDWELDRIIREVQALRPGAFTKPLQVEYISQFRK